MDTHDKAMITINLSFVVALISIESLLASFLSQHLEFIFNFLTFNYDGLFNKVSEIRILLGLWFFVILAFLMIGCTLNIRKYLNQVKEEEHKTKVQKEISCYEHKQEVNDQKEQFNAICWMFWQIIIAIYVTKTQYNDNSTKDSNCEEGSDGGKTV